MIWFAILIPATAMIAGGYIVLIQSQLTEGALRTFGKFLAIWIFALSGLYFVGATTLAMYRGAGMMDYPGHMRHRMMHRDMMPSDTMRGRMMQDGMKGQRGDTPPAADEHHPSAPAPAGDGK
jgi:hypothetical protein